MNSTLKAHLGLLGTNLFFATNYSAIKYFTSNHYSGPLGINIIRVGVSLVLFWILFLFKKPEKRIEKKDFPALILCTLAAIALNQLLFIQGLSLTFPIHAALLTLITPILITIIAGRILHESITITKLIGLLLGASGAVLLVSQREITASGENVVLGDFLVILSAVAYTFYFILVKPLMNKYSAVQVIRWIFTIGFVLTLPFCYTEFTNITWQLFTLKDWFFLFMVVIPGTFFAYVFNVYGIQKLSASKAGAYIYSQPVFAVIIAVIFLKEYLSFYKIVAGLLIFAGVFLSNKKQN
ncbi:MAG TPA: DMT family transporter [Hanamia sp.]|nr:DMT family transporter [Hanamia sp.]